MPLPSAKSKPKFSIESFNWLIYGQEKIGKTEFASQIPDALFIPTEPGINCVEVYNAVAPKECLDTWEEFGALKNEIVKAIDAGKFQYSMVVIDTLDNLYDMCTTYVCKAMKIDHQSDAKWGKAYDMIQTEFERVMIQITSRVKVMFISHSTEKEIENKVTKVNRTQPDLPKKALKWVNGFVDFIGYINQDKVSKQRKIYFEGGETLIAGNRGGMLENEMPFDYSTIVAQINKKGIKELKAEAQELLKITETISVK